MHPENSVVWKLIVNYDENDYTTGIRFVSQQNKCVMKAG